MSQNKLFRITRTWLQKDKTGRWEEAERVPVGTNKASIAGLKQGEEYQFRVMAKNKAGLSEPSDPTDACMAKPRHRKFTDA